MDRNEGEDPRKNAPQESEGIETGARSEASTPEVPAHPLEIMRQVYTGLEFHFEEEDERLSVRLALENMDVTLISWGSPDDVASLIVRLPVRATGEFRARTGEFLHRLNFGSKRKFWELDYNDGEVRLAAYIDTIVGPLKAEHFGGLLHGMVRTADAVFPYLTSVLSGRMTPEFAADQAEAALHALWTQPPTPEEESPPEEE